MNSVFIGTAGWSIPKVAAPAFLPEGSHLQRYGRVLNAVEINSSFYREHKRDTYVKWAASVPKHFRFSVKLFRYFTQEMRLKESGSRLKETIDGSKGLGEKWGVLLVQLPPSLEFVPKDADRFMSALRKHFSGAIVWEPRNQTWKSSYALDTLAAHEMGKVLADPEPCFVPRAKRKSVQPIIYVRLHGRPEIYKSNYSSAFIETLSQRMKETAKRGKPAWYIFDNTTFGHATENALQLQELG